MCFLPFKEGFQNSTNIRASPVEGFSLVAAVIPLDYSGYNTTFLVLKVSKVAMFQVCGSVEKAPGQMLTFWNFALLWYQSRPQCFTPSTNILHCKSFLFLPLLHELVEVLLHILKDKVEVIVLSDYLLQFHHIRMVQLLQRLVWHIIKKKGQEQQKSYNLIKGVEYR